MILWQTRWAGIYRVEYFRWEFFKWEFSRWGLSWVGIFQGRVILAGNFLLWRFFGWELSGENHPDGKQPFADVLQNTEYGFLKIRNFHSKTQILIILFCHCYWLEIQFWRSTMWISCFNKFCYMSAVLQIS